MSIKDKKITVLAKDNNLAEDISVQYLDKLITFI